MHTYTRACTDSLLLTHSHTHRHKEIADFNQYWYSEKTIKKLVQVGRVFALCLCVACLLQRPVRCQCSQHRSCGCLRVVVYAYSLLLWTAHVCPCQLRKRAAGPTTAPQHNRSHLPTHKPRRSYKSAEPQPLPSCPPPLSTILFLRCVLVFACVCARVLLVCPTCHAANALLLLSEPHYATLLTQDHAVMTHTHTQTADHVHITRAGQ